MARDADYSSDIAQVQLREIGSKDAIQRTVKKARPKTGGSLCLDREAMSKKLHWTSTNELTFT